MHSCVKNVMNDVSSLGRFLLPDITTVRPDAILPVTNCPYMGSKVLRNVPERVARGNALIQLYISCRKTYALAAIA